MNKRLSLRSLSRRYRVSVRRRRGFTPRLQWKREFQHALVIAELNQLQEEGPNPHPDFSKMKREMYKQRLRSLEAQLMGQLNTFHDLHLQEMEILDGSCESERLASESKKFEAEIEECLELMQSNKEAEKSLKKMRGEIGGEAVSGCKKKSKWGRIKNALKKFLCK